MCICLYSNRFCFFILQMSRIRTAIFHDIRYNMQEVVRVKHLPWTNNTSVALFQSHRHLTLVSTKMHLTLSGGFSVFTFLENPFLIASPWAIPGFTFCIVIVLFLVDQRGGLLYAFIVIPTFDRFFCLLFWEWPNVKRPKSQLFYI